ncbi:MAG: hypothetical protein WBM52_21540 [Thiogranum sp.]
MAFEKKVSEMIIDVSGTLFDAVDNQQEMQAHLDLVLTAWNMAIKSPVKRKRELERFLEEQKEYAQSAEALKGLEWEMRSIMKRKDRLFPQIKRMIVAAEAIETSSDEYIIRAYFEEHSMWLA